MVRSAQRINDPQRADFEAAAKEIAVKCGFCLGPQDQVKASPASGYVVFYRNPANIQELPPNLYFDLASGMVHVGKTDGGPYLPPQTAALTDAMAGLQVLWQRFKPEANTPSG